MNFARDLDNFRHGCCRRFRLSYATSKLSMVPRDFDLQHVLDIAKQVGLIQVAVQQVFVRVFNHHKVIGQLTITVSGWSLRTWGGIVLPVIPIS